MNILRYDHFRDGGTLVIETDEGTFYVDQVYKSLFRFLHNRISEIQALSRYGSVIKEHGVK